MSEKNNLPKNDRLRAQFEGIDRMVTAPPKLVEAVKSGTPLAGAGNRYTAGFHVRKFAKAAVAYVVGISLFLGLLILLPALLEGAPFVGSDAAEKDLRQRFPEYYDLDLFKGLEIYVWQTEEGEYRCGALSGTNRLKTFEEILTLKANGATIKEMRTILSSYDVEKDTITVISIQITSSEYTIIDVEDEKLREMLLSETPPTESESPKVVFVVGNADGKEQEIIFDRSKNYDGSPILCIDSKETMDAFNQRVRETIYMGETNEGERFEYPTITIYNDAVVPYTEDFFKEKSLIISYAKVNYSPGYFEVLYTSIKEGKLSVLGVAYPIGVDCAMDGRFVFIEMPKSELEGVTEFTATWIHYMQ